MEKTITYLLAMKDNTLKKVTVPESWKVTFGPLCPGSKDNTVNSSGATSLRFYSKGNKQHAVFTGVESFRDMAIQIEERVTTTKQETYAKGNGKQAKQVVVEAQVHQWVDPDKPETQKEQPLLGQLKVVNLD